METTAVILDTNVFVAAGFNPRSASARILEQVRAGRLRMVWSAHTRRETQYVLNRIPRLSWTGVADLFHEETRYDGTTAPEAFAFIPDPDDRKYAALSEATGATLVTNDDHLLRARDRARLEIVTPGEYWEQSARDLDTDGS